MASTPHPLLSRLEVPPLLEEKDGDAWCPLCGKWAPEGHLECGPHKKNVEYARFLATLKRFGWYDFSKPYNPLCVPCGKCPSAAHICTVAHRRLVRRSGVQQDLVDAEQTMVQREFPVIPCKVEQVVPPANFARELIEKAFPTPGSSSSSCPVPQCPVQMGVPISALPTGARIPITPVSPAAAMPTGARIGVPITASPAAAMPTGATIGVPITALPAAAIEVTTSEDLGAGGHSLEPRGGHGLEPRGEAATHATRRRVRRRRSRLALKSVARTVSSGSSTSLYFLPRRANRDRTPLPRRQHKDDRSPRARQVEDRYGRSPLARRGLHGLRHGLEQRGGHGLEPRDAVANRSARPHSA